MLGHFLTVPSAPCALSHRPAIAAAASRHHRCSGHLPGRRGAGCPTVVPFATRCVCVTCDCLTRTKQGAPLS
eukprot:scaffold7551_cov123-Isochrysis_galbana.AAC.6